MQDFKMVLKDFSHQRTASYTNFLKNELEYRKCTKKQVYNFYVWSGLVNSVFWQCIERIEIILRNKINDVLINKVHEDWLNLDNIDITKIHFKDYHKDCIERAVKNLNKKNQQPTNSRLVSELTVGFWVSFNDIGFSHTAIEKKKQNIAWKYFITDVFPNYPVKGDSPRYWSKETNVKKLIRVLKFIQKLRNRIAHHEHIFKQRINQNRQSASQSQREYWFDNIQKNYFLLINVLDWLSPQQSRLYQKNYFHQYACYLISLDGFNHHVFNDNNDMSSLENFIEYLMTVLESDNPI